VQLRTVPSAAENLVKKMSSQPAAFSAAELLRAENAAVTDQHAHKSIAHNAIPLCNAQASALAALKPTINCKRAAVSMHQQIRSDLENDLGFLAGGGATGEHIRAHPWASTP
jgi:hypothetical protein